MDSCLNCGRINYFINDNEHVYKGGDSCSGNGGLIYLYTKYCGM